MKRIALLCCLGGWSACGEVRGSDADGGVGGDGGPGGADAAVAGPHLVVSPTSEAFGSVMVDTDSTPVAFNFRNDGNQTVTGCEQPELGGDHPDDFAIDTDNCGFDDLAPGDSCLVAVTASPRVEGARTATLSRVCSEGGTATTDANGLGVNRPMYIFISSMSYAGDLGGLTGADSLCSEMAAAGSKTSELGLSWKALMSTSTGGVVNARDRFVWTGPLLDVFGNQVTFDPAVWPWADGGDSSSIEFNESGGPPDDSYSFSGTTVDGLTQGEGTDCDGWTNATNAFETTAGETSHFPDATWLESFSSGCDNDYHGIYCVSE